MNAFAPHPHAILIAMARSGHLPDDAVFLLRVHAMANDRLESFAARIEPSWAEAEEQYRETVELLELQAAIVAKLAAQPAWGPTDILRKLTLWRDAAGGPESTAVRHQEKALLSAILKDVERLCAKQDSAADA